MIKSISGVHKKRMPILAMAKEVKESSDIEEIATLIGTYKWVVIAVSRKNKKNTFCLIRIC